MRKKSLTELKAAGWNVSDEEERKLERRQLNQQMAASADRIASAAEALKRDDNQRVGRLETTLEAQTKAVSDLVKNLIEQRSAGWECDVRRNKTGFISKVFIKRTNTLT